MGILKLTIIIRRQSQKEKLMASMGAQRYDGSAC